MSPEISPCELTHSLSHPGLPRHQRTRQAQWSSARSQHIERPSGDVAQHPERYDHNGKNPDEGSGNAHPRPAITVFPYPRCHLHRDPYQQERKEDDEKRILPESSCHVEPCQSVSCSRPTTTGAVQAGHLAEDTARKKSLALFRVVSREIEDTQRAKQAKRNYQCQTVSQRPSIASRNTT